MYDEIEGIMEFQKMFLEEMSEIRSQNMFTFPVNSISLIKKDGVWADEEFAKMVSIRQFKLEQQKKQIVSVRLSSRALNKAKAFGKGYTSLLSQILEKTLADDELLKRYL